MKKLKPYLIWLTILCSGIQGCTNDKGTEKESPKNPDKKSSQSASLDKNQKKNFIEIPLGSAPYSEFNAVVLTPSGSSKSHEINSFDGTIQPSEKSAVAKPFHLAFAPQTIRPRSHGGNEKPVTVVIFDKKDRMTAELVKVKPIGVMRSLKQGYTNDLVLAVPTDSKDLPDSYEKLAQESLAELKKMATPPFSFMPKNAAIDSLGIANRHYNKSRN